MSSHHGAARLKTDHGPENMAVVKHIAMNLVRRAKLGSSLSRKLADWSLDCLHDNLCGTA